jgi:hypothetical protein
MTGARAGLDPAIHGRGRHPLRQRVESVSALVKRKSRTRAAILATEPRCIYCSGLPETLEHMPSRGILRGRERPSGMEYAACTSCNNGTRGSDAVAAVIARLHPDNGENSWQAEETRKLMSALDNFAPGVREELSKPDKARAEWVRRPASNLLQRVVRVHADGPRLKAYLSAYGAKLSMALYREHVGTALPLDGAIWCQFALNGGMTQEHLNERVRILPVQETLRQGQKNVADQFAYRYNCDGRSVLAAVAQFHRGLWFTIFASCDPRIIELFKRPEFLNLPASALVRPGELLQLLPSSAASAA